MLSRFLEDYHIGVSGRILKTCGTVRGNVGDGAAVGGVGGCWDGLHNPEPFFVNLAAVM